MSKEAYVLLSEANYLDDSRLRVNLDLPYNLGEKIEINVRKIDNLRQIGGFKTVSILTDNEPGTSQIIPQIDGVNGDGSIIARKAGIKSVPTGSCDYQKNDKWIIFNRASWPDLKIKVNVDEIKQRIMGSENSIQNNSVWSKELDKTIRSNILKGGTDHLLPRWNEMKFFDMTWSTLFYGTPFYLNDFKVDFGLIPRFFGVLVVTSVAWGGSGIISYGCEKKDKGYRWSLTVGPEIERAVALNIYGRMRAPLVKALDN